MDFTPAFLLQAIGQAVLLIGAYYKLEARVKAVERDNSAQQKEIDLLESRVNGELAQINKALDQMNLKLAILIDRQERKSPLKTQTQTP
jgi:uncharacterized coiled-coil protein SlyX